MTFDPSHWRRDPFVVHVRLSILVFSFKYTLMIVWLVKCRRKEARRSLQLLQKMQPQSSKSCRELFCWGHLLSAALCPCPLILVPLLHGVVRNEYHPEPTESSKIDIKMWPKVLIWWCSNNDSCGSGLSDYRNHKEDEEDHGRHASSYSFSVCQWFGRSTLSLIQYGVQQVYGVIAPLCFSLIVRYMPPSLKREVRSTLYELAGGGWPGVKAQCHYLDITSGEACNTMLPAQDLKGRHDMHKGCLWYILVKNIEMWWSIFFFNLPSILQGHLQSTHCVIKGTSKPCVGLTSFCLFSRLTTTLSSQLRIYWSVWKRSNGHTLLMEDGISVISTAAASSKLYEDLLSDPQNYKHS